MLSNDPIKAVKQGYGALRRSEKKVADLVLSDPSRCVNCSIAELARQASVSEPTVVRFCRAIGCNGYQEFKLRLAQSLGSGSRFAELKLDRKDSPADIAHKVFNGTVRELLNVRDLLNTEQLQQAIEILANAQRIEFYGFGASGAVAEDARHKFIRIQPSTTACADPHIQLISASTMTERDVVVAISQSGRSKELLQSVKLARKHGATVIGICPENTPLAKLCNLPMAVAAEENTELFTPLTSRIVHLVVIDVLATGVAMLKEPELSRQLKKIKHGLSNSRVNN
ncbi:MAG: MurR/RpiR family transcriptional regulator [Endozoicomonas sp.]|uniref:MurR/RpiR family transcriptional regulator n=1 Tax=Endozoicomonas sp. TaxID=1892382 RepID=UPI003D9B9598